MGDNDLLTDPAQRLRSSTEFSCSWANDDRTLPEG
jgi:hypothetical protein